MLLNLNTLQSIRLIQHVQLAQDATSPEPATPNLNPAKTILKAAVALKFLLVTTENAKKHTICGAKTKLNSAVVTDDGPGNHVLHLANYILAVVLLAKSLLPVAVLNPCQSAHTTAWLFPTIRSVVILTILTAILTYSLI